MLSETDKHTASLEDLLEVLKKQRDDFLKDLSHKISSIDQVEQALLLQAKKSTEDNSIFKLKNDTDHNFIKNYCIEQSKKEPKMSEAWLLISNLNFNTYGDLITTLTLYQNLVDGSVDGMRDVICCLNKLKHMN